MRKYATQTGVSHQQIIQNFMFERFLERLTYSKYKSNFIIKGGCLLSSIMGIDVRTTMDIDTSITGITFSKEMVENIIDSILTINLNDSVILRKNKVEAIKEGKEYNGFRFSIVGYFFNLEVTFHIDVSTGDKVTPRSICYRYKMMFEERYIELMAYNFETVIAEKLQSLLDLKLQNSRMKDYYDIYYLITFKYNEINIEVLKEAIVNTFNNRHTLDDLNEIEDLLKTFNKDNILNKLWKNYQAVHSYTKNVDFIEVIGAIEKVASVLKEESVFVEV